jgi:hypothetical protein
VKRARTRERPYCQTAQQWVRERLKDRQAFAPLTGQDWRAWTSFVHLVALYGASDDHGQHSAVLAMAACLSAMQPSTRYLAKAVIPHVLDWGHEERIWRQIEQVAENVTEAVERATTPEWLS